MDKEFNLYQRPVFSLLLEREEEERERREGEGRGGEGRVKHQLFTSLTDPNQG